MLQPASTVQKSFAIICHSVFLLSSTPTFLSSSKCSVKFSAGLSNIACFVTHCQALATFRGMFLFKPLTTDL